jgi:septum formation protein
VTTVSESTAAAAGGERILGKPANPAEARAMLAALSGRTHEVVTGLAVLDVRGGRRVITSARTVLRMKPLSAAELDALSLLPEATAASGGYSLREGGDDLVTIVEGSVSNVMGLPLELLAKVLRLVERPARA